MNNLVMTFRFGLVFDDNSQIKQLKLIYRYHSHNSGSVKGAGLSLRFQSLCVKSDDPQFNSLNHYCYLPHTDLDEKYH